MNRISNASGKSRQRKPAKGNALLASAIAALSLGYVSSAVALTNVNGFNAVDCGVACQYTDSGASGEVIVDKSHSVVSFQNMSIANGELLSFNGTTAGYSLLVRVTDSVSVIQGAIDGNLAQLVISNQNGLVFDGATISNIGAVVATTGEINNFGVDPLRFDIENIDPNSCLLYTSDAADES